MEIFDNFNGISTLLISGLFECIVTSIAMGWDFASGWHKAKLRKEKRNSYGMKRTVSKFILYFGSLTIALCLDSTFYVCHFFEFVHLPVLKCLPVFCSVVTAFLLAVEFRSIWEKAEDKTKRSAEDVVNILQSALTKQQMLDIIKKTLDKETENKEEKKDE